MTVLHDRIDFFDAEFIHDPYPLYDRPRAIAPVHRIGDSAFYVVSGWDAVVEAARRTEEFSSNLTATMVYQHDGTVTPFEMDGLHGPTQVLATADDPVHAAHRKLVLARVAAKRIRSLEPFIGATAARLWTDGLRDGRIEWMGAMANRLPMMVVAQLIGLPHDDVDRLVRWAYTTTQLLDGLVEADQLTAAAIAVTELGGYLIDQFGRAAGDPSDNLLGDFATSCASGELDSTVAALLLVQLVGAGGESTAGLIGNAAWILANQPEIQQQVRDNPDLLGPLIEEVLRYESPFRGHYRHVLVDTTLDGVELTADSHLMMLWGAANRDPAQFEAPNEFRLGRDGNKCHLSFGKGAHFCVGAALARMEARIVLGTLLDRTTQIEAVDTVRWVPSILVRRLESLELAVE